MPKLLSPKKSKKTSKLIRGSKLSGSYIKKDSGHNVHTASINIKTPNGRLCIRKLPINNPESILSVSEFKVYNSIDYNETKRQSIKDFIKQEPRISDFSKSIQGRIKRISSKSSVSQSNLPKLIIKTIIDK